SPGRLVVTQSSEAYVKASLPIVVMKTREAQVSNWEKPAIFSQLFPPPMPDQIIEPIP
ncbi:MAG: hypothetical protein HYR94_01575, partial [Chloroflexi bacterium]|nr:hypothetical protein [Chloroflexota bacterium]